MLTVIVGALLVAALVAGAVVIWRNELRTPPPEEAKRRAELDALIDEVGVAQPDPRHRGAVTGLEPGDSPSLM